MPALRVDLVQWRGGGRVAEGAGQPQGDGAGPQSQSAHAQVIIVPLGQLLFFWNYKDKM